MLTGARDTRNDEPYIHVLSAIERKGWVGIGTYSVTVCQMFHYLLATATWFLPEVRSER